MTEDTKSAPASAGPTQYTQDVVAMWSRFAPFSGRHATEGNWAVDRLRAEGAERVLDAASGTGFHTVEFARHGFAVTAVDGAQTMVEATTKACSQHDVEADIRHASWAELPEAVGSGFDGVSLLGNSLAHTRNGSERRQVLGNIRRVLRPGGVLLVDARGYDAILDHQRPFSGTKVFTGPAGGQPIEISETRVVFEYHVEGTAPVRLEVTPIRLQVLLDDLRAAGFEIAAVYGDFEREFELDDVDFVQVVARASESAVPTRTVSAGSVPPLIVDIDGPLRNGGNVVPHAPVALGDLRKAGHRIALLSNTTSKSVVELRRELEGLGFDLASTPIVTPAAATSAAVRERHPGAKVLWVGDGFPFTPSDELDFVVGEAPDVVILGGLGPRVTFERQCEAMQAAADGAPVYAMHRNLVWETGRGLAPDTGALVYAIESVTTVPVTLIGKPSAHAFRAALSTIDAVPKGAVMIGDDAINDVLAAQQLGLTGVLVLTGKTLPDAAVVDGIDHVVPSIADVPALLATLGFDTEKH